MWDWVTTEIPKSFGSWGIKEADWGDEDDAWTAYTRLAHRKCTIQHSTMKTHRNVMSRLVMAFGNHCSDNVSDLSDDQSHYLNADV